MSGEGKYRAIAQSPVTAPDSDQEKLQKDNNSREESEHSSDGFTEIKSVSLKREIGIIGGISIIAGTMIGSGIFASPRWVMVYSGSVGLTIIVWALCGLISVFGALAYAELGTAIQKSGGEYSYLLEAFGPIPAFMYAWTSIVIVRPSSFAIILLAFAAYVIEPFFPGCGDREDLVPLLKLLAAAAIGIIVFVNCASVRWATNMQVAFTVAKMLALVIIIVTGIVRLAQGHTSSFQNSFKGTTTNIAAVGFAFYNGLWAYDGWNNLNYVTEELKKPKRNLPICLSIAIPLVTGLYIMVNISYLTVLTPQEVMTSSAVAVTLAERLYGYMAWVMPVFVACSTFGAANGTALSGGRVVFAAAREGHLPFLLAMIHRTRRTPLPAIMTTGVLACLMLIPDSSSFETLVNYFSFAAWCGYGGTFVALLWLRYKRRDMIRPFKVWIVIPILLILASIYLIAAPFYEAPVESALCLVFILAGIPVYLVIVRYKVLPSCLTSLFESVTYFLQKLLDVQMPTRAEG